MQLYLWARGAKNGSKFIQSPGSKFIGLRIGRDFWWTFTGQDLSLGLL